MKLELQTVETVANLKATAKKAKDQTGPARVLGVDGIFLLAASARWYGVDAGSG